MWLYEVWTLNSGQHCHNLLSERYLLPNWGVFLNYNIRLEKTGLKRLWQEISGFRFFEWIRFLRGHEYSFGLFRIFMEFAEISATEGWSPVLTTLAKACTTVSKTPTINVSNDDYIITPCHRFYWRFLISGGNYISD